MLRILLASMLLFFPGSLLAQDSGAWDARIVAVKGRVQVMAAGTTEAKPLPDGLPLEEGDRLITGMGASCEIAFEGGRLIRLNGQSELLLGSMRRDASVLTLLAGELLARIKSLTAGQALSVRTKTAVLAVRGTKFGVSIPRENSRTTIVGVFDEGRLEVSGSSGKPVFLDPNKETSVAAGRGPAAPTKLSRFAGRREAMASVARRAEFVESHWEALSAGRRATLRSAVAQPPDANGPQLRSVPRTR